MTELTGLALLRVPFEDKQISKLPKPTKQQTDEVKADFKKGVRCDICGGWHHPKVIHLDYVGHAALTNRLLDVDPKWTWEPLALDAEGLPKFDKEGGLWIKLKILDVVRFGYGTAPDKKGGDAIKEIIGDALRNAAMRFGAALDLWHKGEPLNSDDGDSTEKEVDAHDHKNSQSSSQTLPPDPMEKRCLADFKAAAEEQSSMAELDQWKKDNWADITKSLTGPNLIEFMKYFNGVRSGLSAIGA